LKRPFLRNLILADKTIEVRCTEYADTITLRRVITTGQDDVSFSFDEVREQQGDYYYVRARQTRVLSLFHV
jgi:hypothetical protein